MWDVIIPDYNTFYNIIVYYLSIFADVVEELSSRDILHHHEDICRGANNLIPADMNKTLQSCRSSTIS